MKRGKFHVVLVGFALVASQQAAAAAEHQLSSSVATSDQESNIDWYNAPDIGLEGKAWQDTESYFHRLPARAKGVVRDPVWSLSQHTAGFCLRFATDADAIHARWTVTSPRLAMPHMSATGVSGVDLYVLHNSDWRWLAEGQPTQQTNSLQLISGLAKAKREYLLYLPLYNGVQSLEIGVSSGSRLWQLSMDGDAAKPIVFWGTSITHGACASRPGMPHPAILGRRFGRPVINLGFSGNGKMESEVAQLLAEIDAAVFVIDCLPNLTGELVRQRARPVVDILREAHPTTPILLVEDRTFADAFLVESRRQRNQSNRKALRESYLQMLEDNVSGIHYLSGEELLGSDGEGTVDGSHPNDLGFLRQADAFEAALRPLLRLDAR